MKKGTISKKLTGKKMRGKWKFAEARGRTFGDRVICRQRIEKEAAQPPTRRIESAKNGRQQYLESCDKKKIGRGDRKMRREKTAKKTRESTMGEGVKGLKIASGNISATWHHKKKL